MPKALCEQAREMIASLMSFMEKERDNYQLHRQPLIPFEAVRERVATALNINISTVSTISQAVAKNEPLGGPNKTRTRTRPVCQIDDAAQCSIRNVIYEMYRTKQHITRKTVFVLLKARGIFNGSLSSLEIVLRGIGFRWKKDDPRRGLMELAHIAIARVNFLQAYVRNMHNDYSWKFLYLDETWIFENGSINYSWQDSSSQSIKKIKSEGKRYIVLHAGIQDGFIPGVSLVFSSSTQNPDYHGEMNHEKFVNWFQTQLLMNLEEPSMIVMDNAPYHSKLEIRNPTANWRKEEIQTWLRSNNISFEANMLKTQLLQLVSLNKPEKVYIIDQLAESYGHKVLRLPPYHCIFNPIENIWGISKTYYNRHIGRDGYGVEKCVNMWTEALNTINKTTWQNTIAHTEKEIMKWWNREVGFDTEDISPVIINIGESNSGSDTEDEENL